MSSVSWRSGVLDAPIYWRYVRQLRGGEKEEQLTLGLWRAVFRVKGSSGRQTPPTKKNLPILERDIYL